MLFYKPFSFTEGGLWLLALPGGSSISVMGGCGGLHCVPVNFNHIKLAWSFTEGMSALYSTPPPHSALEPEIAFLNQVWKFYENKGQAKIHLRDLN